jgi:hypothetical protein
MTNTSDWRKSSHSHLGGTDGFDCVEAGRAQQLVALRDTKDRDRGMITVSRGAFSQLLAGLRG